MRIGVIKIVCLLGSPWLLVAQSAWATEIVTGTVTDPSGAAVPGAHISLSADPAGSGLATITDEGGRFRFPAVAAGTRKLVVTSPGFQTATVDLAADNAREADLHIQLKLAEIGSTVAVTGTRQDVEIRNSPVAINVVSRSDFEIRNVKLVDQTLAYSEGISITRNKGVNDMDVGIGMRGFSGRSGAQARVLVLLDGQPINDSYSGEVNWNALPITEMDRVEVARGPSSSLYGGNAMGGVIQLFTRPVTRRTVELSAQYGTYAAMMYSARYSDRLWNRLGLTLAYQRTQVNGYSVSGLYATASPVSTVSGPLVAAPPFLLATTGTGRYQIGNQGDNWFNSHSFRGRADYTFSEKTTATFQIIQPRHEYGYDLATSMVLDSAGAPVTSGSFTFNDGGLKRITLSPSVFLGGPGGTTQYLFSGSLFHTFNTAHWVRIAGGSANLPDYWFTTPAASATFVGGPGTTAESPTRSSHAEIQWNWTKSSRHRFVFGTEARQERARTLDYNLDNFAIRDSKVLLTRASSGLDLMTAAFAQDDITISNKLTMVIGGRYDNVRVYSGRSQAGPTDPLVVYPSRIFQAWSGKVGLAWQAPGRMTVRASIGNAFRAPTIANLYRSLRYPPGSVTLPNPNLEPERMTSWEFGVRRQFGQHFDADLTYFQNYVKNLIYLATDLVSDPAGTTRKTFNAGRSRTTGVEFAMRQRLRTWLRISETYTLNDARITRNDFIPLSQGRYVPYVPRNTATFSLLGDRKGWSGSISGRYVSRTFSTDVNTDYVKGVPGSWDPFFEMEASAGYRFKKYLTLFASVQNLLNRQYYEFYLSPGRSVSVGLRFRTEGKQ